MRRSTEKQSRITEAIISARKKAGLSQMQVSAQLGMPPNFMSKVESGKRDVRAWELYDLADVLGVDPRDLLGPPRRIRRSKTSG
jgi:transcriptional regulator with XRE-family HTH domain